MGPFLLFCSHLAKPDTSLSLSLPPLSFSLSLSLPHSVLCALPLLPLFEYLMRGLTLRYHALFLVLSSGLGGCSPPLTPPGCEPETDTVSDRRRRQSAALLSCCLALTSSQRHSLISAPGVDVALILQKFFLIMHNVRKSVVFFSFFLFLAYVTQLTAK